ncbi:sugar phosphate isomerase/epimerase family protein [Asaia bogorensis]|uniref:Xylose isomerase n=1 Tax=Asaia bogorensis NBRC 16594 TaxID=1231624 RepID=A0AAN4U2Y1_9PROT|nr:sugar phosphate isomerase/epimerase family protein [Asaia bogorensis]BAT18593.1 4-hydroxyphenylpyruvate dioxygenase [Asaia bogorensis NBRC 16594]GBQ75230.1 4-hydroxyphenylpyruvate dioxygenase [Asaia bogorensis NBRC 16594]GEL52945.1 xylose isomerase [Asaia bogorensis NBRC 16594]
MSPFPFAFGMNQFTTQPWSFEQDVEHYARLGVQAIEICEAKLDADNAPRQMEMAKEAGLAISAVQPSIRTFFGSQMAPEPQATQARVTAFADSLKRLAPYAEGASFVMNTGAPPEGDMQRCLDETQKHLRTLAPLAADLGVKLAIEPLNPVSINVETAIWTIDQALDVIEAVGHSSCGLCLDYWNIWQQPDCAGAIRRAGTAILVVQASDWRTPRSGMDRLIPGEGAIPLGALMKATYDAGYRGACTVEIFSSGVEDSLYDRDLATVIRQSHEGLLSAWEESQSCDMLPRRTE